MKKVDFIQTLKVCLFCVFGSYISYWISNDFIFPNVTWYELLHNILKRFMYFSAVFAFIYVLKSKP